MLPREIRAHALIRLQISLICIPASISSCTTSVGAAIVLVTLITTWGAGAAAAAWLLDCRWRARTITDQSEVICDKDRHPAHNSLEWNAEINCEAYGFSGHEFRKL